MSERFLQWLYNDTTRKLIRATGLRPLVSEYYWRARYHRTGQYSTQSVAETEIDFFTESYEEFLRFQNLVGERDVIRDLIRGLNDDDIVYDVGANVGMYTCFIVTHLHSGTVVAFEPVSKNAERLNENLELNGLDAEIIQMVLSDTNGTIDISLTGEEAGEGEHAIATDDDAETIEVETAKGDSIIERRNLPTPTVVKIDVEGAELSVLRGLRETLRENCRLVYVEVHPEKITDFGANAPEVREFLEELEFDVEKLTQRGSEVFLRASK